MKKLLLSSILSALGFASVQGATLIWNFTDLNATVDTVDGVAATPAGVGPFTAGNTTTTINATSPSTYSGASAGGNFGISAKLGALDTSATGSSYYSLTLTPDATGVITVSDFDFGTRSTGSGPINYSLRSSVNSFATELLTATGTLLADSNWVFKNNTFTGPVAGAAGVPVELRLFVYGGNATAANSRMDDVSIVATGFSNVPEPGTITTLFGGIGILVGFRRVRRIARPDLSLGQL